MTDQFLLLFEYRIHIYIKLRNLSVKKIDLSAVGKIGPIQPNAQKK